MSEIKNGPLDQYGAEPFEQRLFGTAGVEGVKTNCQTRNDRHGPRAKSRTGATECQSSLMALIAVDHLHGG